MHSLVGGHLGCFHCGAVVNRAFMSIGYQSLCGQTSFLLNKYLGMELLSPMVSIYLTVKKKLPRLF